MMRFDGEALIRQFNSVWDEHDIDGIVEMFTDDVIFETSFGSEPFGERAVGKEEARKLAVSVFERVPDLHFKELRTSSRLTLQSSSRSPLAHRLAVRHMKFIW